VDRRKWLSQDPYDFVGRLEKLSQDLSGVAVSEGNVFHPRKDLSTLTLHQAGTYGLGTVFTHALESSTVDIAQQLSDMVKTQHAYSANTRAIATTSEMLDMLERI
jgi:flagellar hook protein FlgE